MGLSANLTDLDLACLQELLWPVSARDFLDQSWGRQFAHVEGPKDKFKSLFPWSLLNTVLEQHPLEPPRLRLYKDGKDIDPEHYLVSERLGNRDQVKRLRAQELTKELKQGSTLVLNCAEEASPALRELCIALERIFRVYIIVNLYVAFGSDSGFPLHWDSQDTLILQLSGRKKWSIFEPTRLHPLREDEETPAKPSAPPIWEGILEAGALFHIPRGWWHIAYAVDEPSLHLTVTVKSPTGLDLLRWCVDGLKAVTDARANLPLLKSSEDRQKYAETLKQEFLKAWSPDMVDRFIAHRDSWAAARPKMNLPESATAEGPPVQEDSLVRLSSPRPLVFKQQRGSNGITFQCNRKIWQCPELLLPVMKLLNDGRGHSVGELASTVNGNGDHSGVKQFVAQLAQAGVLVVETPERKQTYANV